MTHLELIIGLKAHLNRNLNDGVRDIILFGSRSKNTASEFSDYDILIVLYNDVDWKEKNTIVSLIYEYELEHEVFFDSHFLSLNEINNSQRGRQPIFIEALEKGVYA
jgi:predicted nucleotidyltransferase